MNEAHVRFHAAAGEIIRRTDRGDKLAVDIDLGSGSPYAQASREVIGALNVLRTVANA